MYENSVYEMPASRVSNRCLTESRWIIWLTAKCLPTSRRKSSSRTCPSQSRLSTTCTGGPSSAPAKNFSICARILPVLSRTLSSSSSVRSLDLPDGSPIIPVAPPTSGSTLCPCRRRWVSSISGTRFPACRLVAVGSKPE